MSLPPEKLEELKNIVHSYMSQTDIQNDIKNVISNSFDIGNNDLQEEDVISMLKERGLIDDIMSQLHFQTIDEEGSQYYERKPQQQPLRVQSTKDTNMKTSAPVGIDPTRRYLYFQTLGGKAFLDHIQNPDLLPGQKPSYLTLHLSFCGQRFKSRPTPSTCEPNIQEGFLMELHKEPSDASILTSNSSLLSLGQQVHMVLVKSDPTGETHLLCSQSMEWRSVLAAPNGRCTHAIELKGIGSENSVTIGILEVRLELIPRMTEALKEDIVTMQCSIEKKKQAERDRLFLTYAKQWWKEYLQIRQTHQDRLVKIFAQDENQVNRPVCAYVQPLRAGRLLDTPRQATRFVSLLGYEKAATVGGGGGRAEQWSSTHAFLCRGRGDCEDHAVLLCSLLLGFGLDAYVCVGTKGKGGSHAWVLVLGVDGGATFWESLTGHRYVHKSIDIDDFPREKQNAYPYRTIGCVFNHHHFFANSQTSDRVEICNFDFADESLWKAMSREAIMSVTDNVTSGAARFPPLYESTIHSGTASATIELELKQLVTEHRRNQGLTTTWDENLSYLLTPALAAYETERLTGVTAGNEEFQQAIRRSVPDGHTFKGYPIQFVHCNAQRALAACLRSSVCEEIINCRGDFVRLAVRAKVVVYPENTLAVWIMFACKYKSVV